MVLLRVATCALALGREGAQAPPLGTFTAIGPIRDTGPAMAEQNVEVVKDALERPGVGPGPARGTGASG